MDIVQTNFQKMKESILSDIVTSLSDELNIKFRIAQAFGQKLDRQSVILDFGCGSGRYVKELRDHGYESYGCGTRYDNEEGIDTKEMIDLGIIRILDLENYVLPFKDSTFDFIFSDNVFEHVQNYPVTISEIARVLKPTGCCLHIFPSRLRPVESHIYVPFSSAFQPFWWLYLWTLLGIKNEWKDSETAKKRAIRFHNYLRDETKYLTRPELREAFKMRFQDVAFCEGEFLKFSRRGRHIYSLSKVLTFIPWLYSTFRSRVLLTKMPKGK